MALAIENIVLCNWKQFFYINYLFPIAAPIDEFPQIVKNI